ncbi:erythroblast NAD(P)(+)--arginine ADP-ribosyltransferase-like [Melozone crissalis]|uniref:erythroblast NAD(P)(+)--arginine ADP-ribosyltransferase-like n=1 Tax=Melozone crissalis TaxID=40204 RepID=UPI0023DB702B|nr:erythroblast NAD(P)(+)--arginine ADP-ribosyltransferase-like [Melozone crissalis]
MLKAEGNYEFNKALGAFLCTNNSRVLAQKCPHQSLWPLPVMTPLAQTLALLALAMATTALDVIPLDMAPDSFDDQYRGCGPAMKAALLTLSWSEFEQNKEFVEVWGKAMATWQSRGPPESPLSPDQAIAIMAFTMTDPRTFNDVVRVVGHSPQEYRDNFHFKTLHFLLTDALATLRDAQKGQCREAFLKVCGTQFEAQHGDTVRFGHFMPVFPSKQIGECPGETMLELRTCHGVEITLFSEHPEPEIVLIPPFETFKVTQYTHQGDKTQIQLHSSGTYSKYNCEWLGGDTTGGSVQSAPFHVGGLLLASTALAVATGIL